MDHEEALTLLPAYVDRELSVTDSMAVERHLESCSACRQEYTRQEEFGRRLKQEIPYVEAPLHLSARIRSALPSERKPFAKARRFSLGAVLAALLAVSLGIGVFLDQSSGERRLTEEVTASHVRSLQVDHLTDVASSDRHTVKPWFNGKLNFAPPVVDLSKQGFPLVGGRLDYLGDHPVVALVYRHNLHPINLYVWPTSERDRAPQGSERSGYHIWHWTAQGMEYWAISDAATEDVERFATILRTEASGK